jgi:RimJ/RimL family protein N-acetyltransferase
VSATLEGRLVRLRARDEGDDARNFLWMNDPDVTHFIEVRYPTSHRAQVAFVANDPGPGYGSGRFAIDTLDGVHIGNVSLRQASPEDRSAELGITIGDKRYWDRGYGSDAMYVTCRFGFQHMNLHRIGLDVFDDNPRAMRVYERLGFVHEGRKRDADFRDGKYRDKVMMSLLEDELRADP